MLVLTLVFWVGLITIYYVVNDAAIWNEYGWWLLLMIAGTYFFFMDVKLMLMIMRHEEKKKWKHYKLNSNPFK